MTLRFRNKRALRTLPKEHPQRLARLVRVVPEDLERLAHPALGAYLEDLRAALSMAESTAGRPDEAEAAEQAAHESRIAKAARALRKGDLKPAVKLMTAAPDTAMTRAGALLACEAAERALLDAHADAVQAVHDAWPEVRRQLIADAQKAHAEAAKAVATARAKTAAAHDLYGAVGRVDSDLLDRFPDERQQAEAELRNGQPWYASTHRGAQPLKTMPQPGARPQGMDGKIPTIDLALVLETLEAAVGEPDVGAFPAGEWLPVNDPEHAALVDAPPAAPAQVTAD